MSPKENQAWIYTADPEGPFRAAASVELRAVGPAPPCPEKGFLARTLAVPVSPSFRARMRSGKSDTAVKDTFGWWVPGQVFPTEVVAEVVESRCRAYTVGDRIFGVYPLQTYFAAMADGSDNGFRSAPMKLRPDAPLEKQFSALAVGGGLSAYMAIEYCHRPTAAEGYASSSCSCWPTFFRPYDPRYAGKVAVVTAAASTVGMVAGQLYKLKGCKKVIGVTSTREKADQLMTLGAFDAVITYKTEDLEQRLRELAPEGVDIDFENVGGPQLDAVMRCMNKFGKVILCGTMHDCDRQHAQAHGCREYGLLVGKSIEMTGFFVVDYITRILRSVLKMNYLVRTGKVKTVETVVRGFHRWGEALERVLQSENIGRMVLLADEC